MSRHPKARGEETLLNWCTVPQLDPERASSPVLKHLPPSGPAVTPDPPFSSLLVWVHSHISNKHCGREEDGESGDWEGGGDYQTWPRWFVLTEGGVSAGCFGVGVKVWRGDVWRFDWGLFVLMSRRRSSVPPWSAPRPPDPGRPWSWCPGTRAWRRRSSGRPSWLPKSSDSESEEKVFFDYFWDEKQNVQTELMLCPISILHIIVYSMFYTYCHSITFFPITLLWLFILSRFWVCCVSTLVKLQKLYLNESVCLKKTLFWVWCWWTLFSCDKL